MALPIFVDDNGAPLPGRPDAPPANAPIEEFVAYLRARNVYMDSATDRANAAFVKAFNKAVLRRN